MTFELYFAIHVLISISCKFSWPTHHTEICFIIFWLVPTSHHRYCFIKNEKGSFLQIWLIDNTNLRFLLQSANKFQKCPNALSIINKIRICVSITSIYNICSQWYSNGVSKQNSWLVVLVPKIFLRIIYNNFPFPFEMIKFFILIFENNYVLYSNIWK